MICFQGCVRHSCACSHEESKRGRTVGDLLQCFVENSQDFEQGMVFHAWSQCKTSWKHYHSHKLLLIVIFKDFVAEKIKKIGGQTPFNLFLQKEMEQMNALILEIKRQVRFSSLKTYFHSLLLSLFLSLTYSSWWYFLLM